jgi:hypothetical protein
MIQKQMSWSVLPMLFTLTNLLYQGGIVIFNAFTDAALDGLCDDWDHIRRLAPVTPRSRRKSPFALQSARALMMEYPERGMSHEMPTTVDLQFPGGNQKAAGKRLPVGGAPGDTYSHYSWMGSETIEQRDAIFRYAQVKLFTYSH